MPDFARQYTWNKRNKKKKNIEMRTKTAVKEILNYNFYIEKEKKKWIIFQINMKYIKYKI